MASFRLMHRLTGVVLDGYRVLSATTDEINRANHRLRESGSPMRFVIDLHPPKQAVCDPAEAEHPAEATTALSL
jgi:hypothetical protein